MNDKVKEAIAVFDKSAERTTPNAQTQAWATIRAHIEGLEADAARYWFVRSSDCRVMVLVTMHSGDNLDAAIDAAMRGKGK